MKTKVVNQYDLDRISSRMKKSFGSIPKGQEENYSFILSAMEGNMLKLHRQNPNRSGRQALIAIQMALLTVDGYIRQVEYDYSSHVEPKNQDLLHGLLMSFDPFTNKEIQEIVIQEDGSFNAKKYFETPIKCLIRIEDSIKLWTKERGSKGYFTFIENHMGRIVAIDDEMNFTIVGEGIKL
jgi:small nuclear ribonucleoprotein (snRNP)-like protein